MVPLHHLHATKCITRTKHTAPQKQNILDDTEAEDFHQKAKDLMSVWELEQAACYLILTESAWTRKSCDTVLEEERLDAWSASRNASVTARVFLGVDHRTRTQDACSMRHESDRSLRRWSSGDEIAALMLAQFHINNTHTHTNRLWTFQRPAAVRRALHPKPRPNLASHS